MIIRIMETMDHVYLIELDSDSCELIEIYLKNENIAVTRCSDLDAAREALSSQAFDLIILDINLPGTDGFAYCRCLREAYACPIMLLSTSDSETDKIMGLAMGADDYISKPFRPLELIARVKAHIRRYKRYNTTLTEQSNSKMLSYKELSLNTEKHTCTLAKQSVVLTPKEFAILEILLLNQGKVVTIENLFENVWHEKYFGKNNSSITVHIRHLREKLNDTVEQPKYIRTVWGVGYMIGGE